MNSMTEALELALQYVEWQRPVSYDAFQETIGGFPRYEREAKPNKEAQRRANEIREVAGLPARDYAREFGDA
jgi:hypothetical protein